MRIRFAAFMTMSLLIASGLGGCSSNDAGPAAGNGKINAPAETPPGASDAGKDTPRLPSEDAAPELEVKTFDDRTFTLAGQRGTPVVLNFWESW